MLTELLSPGVLLNTLVVSGYTFHHFGPDFDGRSKQNNRQKSSPKDGEPRRKTSRKPSSNQTNGSGDPDFERMKHLKVRMGHPSSWGLFEKQCWIGGYAYSETTKQHLQHPQSNIMKTSTIIKTVHTSIKTLRFTALNTTCFWPFPGRNGAPLRLTCDHGDPYSPHCRRRDLPSRWVDRHCFFEWFNKSCLSTIWVYSLRIIHLSSKKRSPKL